MSSKLDLSLTSQSANFVLDILVRGLTLRRSQNPAKHLKWSCSVKIVNGLKPFNYFCKKPSSQMFDGVLTMPLLSCCKFQTIFSVILFGTKITGFVKLSLFVGPLRGVVWTNQTSEIELFVEIVKNFSAVNYFRRKLHLRSFIGPNYASGSISYRLTSIS